MMETIKNFLVGIFVVLLALTILGLCFFLWPILLGLGSFVLFGAAIVLGILLGFYLVILIGFIVRKGLKREK